MILADKITEERKKLGLSQEELAEKISVSRQAVSKWESAQSVPDLQRIIQMSELFSVSTDYLLKDNIESCNMYTEEGETESPLYKVSMEEANQFLQFTETERHRVATGVQLCILSPVLLIALAGLADNNIWVITEPFAVAAGLLVLFLLVATAVYLFIVHGIRSEPFAHLREMPFEIAYGVSGLVKEQKMSFAPTYTSWLSIGIVLCTLSPLPLLITAVKETPGYILTAMVSLLLIIVSIGVRMIVQVAIMKGGFDVLLQKGDYTVAQKAESHVAEQVGRIYWGVVTAGYLTWSFLTNDWHITWIVWPIAGVLFAPFVAIVKIRINKKTCV